MRSCPAHRGDGPRCRARGSARSSVRGGGAGGGGGVGGSDAGSRAPAAIGLGGRCAAVAVGELHVRGARHARRATERAAAGWRSQRARGGGAHLSRQEQTC